MVVGQVVDVLAVAARLHEPQAPEQTKLMGHRGLSEPEEVRQVTDRHLGPPERIEGESSEIIVREAIRFIDRARSTSGPQLSACVAGPLFPVVVADC